MSGRWVELEHSWHETNVVHCGAGELEACSPECEQLYESYWKPTYGVMTPG